VRAAGPRRPAGVAHLPHVLSVHGRGLMLACEIGVSAPEVVRRALLEQRLIVNATGPATVRLLPPLTIAATDVDEALVRLGAALAG
jgi:acetylornithine/N-succinyldiaminopimelate aminotransferase